MDPVSVSIGIGLVVSLLLTELFALAAGGMVVPGYLALFLDKPIVLALTLGAAFLTWRIAQSVSQRVIVYGKRRTALMILVGFLTGFTVRLVATQFAGTPDGPAPADFAIVGYIIPGLMAIWIDRQGLVETFSVVLTASCIVRLVLMTCGMEVMA